MLMHASAPYFELLSPQGCLPSERTVTRNSVGETGKQDPPVRRRAQICASSTEYMGPPLLTLTPTAVSTEPPRLYRHRHHRYPRHHPKPPLPSFTAPA